MAESIRKKTYGNPTFKTPYGKRHLVYADTTASGQAYHPIEEYIEKKVYPYYANTHSNAFAGRYMTRLICQAKTSIRKAVKAQDCDRVLFTGNGCTGAILHFIHAMNLRDSKGKWTVFISGTEHNSNYLPWKHLPVKLEIIDIDKNGKINIKMLENALKKIGGTRRDSRSRILACFSAGSNVTGVIQDVHGIARLVHRYGGYVAYDYAAIAPYVPINMHRNSKSGDYFDAIFISPHKFLGGPGTCGLLIANNKCFRNGEPCYPGGGTVRFVSTDRMIYSSDIEIKENGGTPNIIASIKSGLVFKLKQQHLRWIIKRNEQLVRAVQGELGKIKGLHMLNPTGNMNRVPIFSFVIVGLHYNFVVVLLNDLFGIQSRGGISCCGIFAQYLLHLSKRIRNEICDFIVGGRGVPKEYGWCRISFNYYMPNYMVSYICQAVKFVAEYGKAFKPHYRYDCQKNIWVRSGWKPDLSVDDGIGNSVGGIDHKKAEWISQKDCMTNLKRAKKLVNKK